MASEAQADEEQREGRTVFGGSLGVAIQTGEFGDAAGPAIGSFMQVARFLNSGLAVTGSFGLLYHLEEGSTQLTELPLFGGLEYYLGSGREILIFGEVGIVGLRSSVDLGIASLTETETKFGSQWGVGYAVGPGMIQASILIPSVPDVGDGFNVMGSYRLSIVQQ